MNKLYNLQTLILTDCPNLIDLPKDMGNLINHRHLFLSTNCQLEQMPIGMGRLTCLQDLPYFVVGKQSIIGELRNIYAATPKITEHNKSTEHNKYDRCKECQFEQYRPAQGATVGMER
ncbi:hypothetical protein Ddye_023388 [Dipteronia dyeriana]|uniref:Uncharacterized protein n=1 Tax=Dipteronia dyeriana TaxID=168575 RepID=A0AAD9WTC5_9ROSI|nr:hypothetical protein Ddye_023388 [Dipteronia dyeriana]